MTVPIPLEDSIVKELDQLVEEGRYRNRAEAVRAALLKLLDEIREQRIDAAIIEGLSTNPRRSQ